VINGTYSTYVTNKKCIKSFGWSTTRKETISETQEWIRNNAETSEIIYKGLE
jgi:hypothetical protein